MMNVSRLLRFALPVVLIAGVAAGCSPQSMPKVTQEEGYRRTQDGVLNTNDVKSTPAERNPNPKTVEEIRQPQRSERAPRIAANNQNNREGLNAQADEIAETVTRIPGVERAAVLLTGKTALVGIDLAAQITGSKIDSIKFSVKEAAERTGPGYQAVVSSDIDTVTRVRELIKGVRAGKPIDTAGDEIADIVSRLLPEM